MFEHDHAGHGAEHVGGAALVVAEHALVVDVHLKGRVVVRVEDVHVVCIGLERLVVLDPRELGARFGQGGTRHVHGAAEEAVRLFGVLLEPSRLV